MLADPPVRAFDHAVASAALDALPLTPVNRALCDYWLSLWKAGALPHRKDFVPSKVRDALPGIMIMEIKKGAYVRIRLAGTAISQVFGRDITGEDMIALSPEAERAGRLERNAFTADGAAALTMRQADARLGGVKTSQELQLPFADITPDGARLVLFHTSWRPATFEPGVPDVYNTLEHPTGWQAIALWRE